MPLSKPVLFVPIPERKLSDAARAREARRSYELYGIEWPAGTSEATVELGCYRIGGTEKYSNYGLPAWQHLYRAACCLFLERDYARHYWVARRFRDWCANGEFQTWIGPGSVAKSTDAAVIVLLHWLSAPDKTTVTVCSTTKDMLEKRIWGEIVKYYSKLGTVAPGRLIPSGYQIVMGDENSKNGIFGIAILKGTVKEAMGNIVGVHNVYNVLVIDEMQATRPAAVEAVNNLSASGKEFKFLGMGNPESRLDPLGRYSIPLAGWDSVHPDRDEHWDTRYGALEFYDGYKSPAIVEENGAAKYPFLLSMKQMLDAEKWYGKDSPEFWSQRRGFFPPEGLSTTLFSESLFVSTRSFDKAIWEGPFITYGALDPAFSSGGDRPVLKFARVGNDINGNLQIEFTDTVVIQLSVSQRDTIAKQLVKAIKQECSKRGVLSDNFALDCTGTQVTLADVLFEEFGRHIFRVDFAGKASQFPISRDDDTLGCDRYGNRVTELWHIFYEFTRCGQIYGMDIETSQEFISRQKADKLKPVLLESKKEMKKRTGYSPDNADAAVVLTALLKEKCGIFPGKIGEYKEEEIFAEDIAQAYDLDSHATYVTEADEIMEGYQDGGDLL